MSDIFLTSGMAALAILVGFAVGWLHFRSLRLLATRMVEGHLSAVALQALRFAGLGLFFYLCARLGATVLLAAAAGVLVARALVLRRERLQAL